MLGNHLMFYVEILNELFASMICDKIYINNLIFNIIFCYELKEFPSLVIFEHTNNYICTEKVQRDVRLSLIKQNFAPLPNDLLEHPLS